MTTLHIEHPISDYTVWKAAFDGYAEHRLRSGVTQHRVLRPLDDFAYVVVDLDFATPEQASAFLDFLRGTVWSTPRNSPALAGAPQTRILALAEQR